jgi:uncharacterized protein DUF5989/saxitoxin biosynthesis operon SxtJ-like protein
MAIDTIDPANPKEQRKFGLVIMIALLGLAFLRWWHRPEDIPIILLGLAGVFLVLTIAFPRPLRPLLAGWLKFAIALNWVMTRILLTIVFYGMITPTAWLMRLVGTDPLSRAWQPEATTYWEDPEEPTGELDDSLHQSTTTFLGTLIEFAAFLWMRKLFWLAPIVLALVLLSLLMALSAKVGILSPFIYAF